MKLIANIYKHEVEGFEIEVVTCNKRIATTINTKTGQEVKFNRSKLEWMIKKGVFTQTNADKVEGL